MIEDGVLDGVDAAIALHVWSSLPAGICYFDDGYSLASADLFKAWLRAPGGHGAYPHESKDPLFALGPVLTALYGIASRRIDPLRQSVVSLGQIHAGTAANIIPSEIFLEGTIRAYEPAVRQQLWVEVENAFKIAEVMGGCYEFQLTKGYPAMVNDLEVNGWIRLVAGDLLGQTAVENAEFGMGAEDFAFMTKAVKGAMFMLGAAGLDDTERKHHTDTFDINEQILPIGAAVLAETARRFVTGQF
jgi:amidohydrolase